MHPPALLLTFCLLLVAVCYSRAAAAEPDLTAQAREFVAAHEQRLRPLDLAAARAWWEAMTTGSDAAFSAKEAAENKINEALSDRQAFAAVKALNERRDGITDANVKRCVELLYLAYLEKQVDPALLKEMVARSNAVEKAFNTFRAKVDGKEMTDSEVREVLKASKDSNRRRAVWEASKAVGPVVEPELKALVKLRNRAAVELGFKNYHEVQLALNEQKTADVMRLFDELDALTGAPFAAAKAQMDAKLAANCGVGVGQLMPWHYHDPFFQEAPAVSGVDLDAPYRNADVLKICRDFYAGIGLPVDDVLSRSDLYEKKGKSPHAFCTDIDREGDVRVLANVVPNEYWAGTMLHELGHSVYSSKNIPRSLPYTLRGDAHILATEGVAMQFERFSRSARFLEAMGLKVEDKSFAEAAARSRRDQLLIFSRWCQVMLRFEKGMYEDPDRDLNTLWWDLVERYQQVKRPPERNAPDYGSKIHIVSSPVYYHNYMMGQLFASQVHAALCREVLGAEDPRTASYVGRKEVGDWMKKHVFEPGRTLNWNDLTKYATGRPLEADAFAAEFSKPR